MHEKDNKYLPFNNLLFIQKLEPYKSGFLFCCLLADGHVPPELIGTSNVSRMSKVPRITHSAESF